MSTFAVFTLVVLMSAPTNADSQTPTRATPADTLLVMKNGSEVRGVFVEMRDEAYVLRLVDDRLMKFSTLEVERMAKLPPPVSTGLTPTKVGSVDAAACRTYISEAGLPPTHYTVVKDIKVSKKWYGSTSEMFGALATQARKVRADGVINVRTWHAPSGFAWAAPHAGGMAIKWTEAGRAALSSLEGRCY